jgi:aminopeptidase C
MEKIITNKLLKDFEKRYQKNINNKIIENSIIKNGIRMSSLNNDVVKKHNFEFSVETKLGSITNQKNSGRC